MIKSNLLKVEITEYAITQLILNNLDDFLLKLGIEFTYVGNEYKIKVGNTYNYIDIKTIEENDTVGIIICKRDNKYLIEFCSDDRIIIREYELV